MINPFLMLKCQGFTATVYNIFKLILLFWRPKMLILVKNPFDKIYFISDISMVGELQYLTDPHCQQAILFIGPKEAQGVFQIFLLAEYYGTYHDST